MLLTRALSNQIVDLLMPHLPDVKRRQTLVQMAIVVPALRNRITWEGAAYEFTVLLYLLKRGEYLLVLKTVM